jgi:DNA-binding transcriptional LysR family regulator
MSPQSRIVPYKETRLQQLRSFCETARLGSLAAAAQSLGLSQPTVWKQVHALERDFGAKLVEPHGRGCRLTDDGRLLAELAAPWVAGIDALRRAFEEGRSQREVWLTIAGTHRVLAEDLPRSLAAFQREHAHVHLRLHALRNTEITPAVEAGEADLGFTGAAPPKPASAWLMFEPAYQPELLLVTPKDHPLARRRRVTPRDLVGYSLVNARGTLLDPEITAALDKLGLFEAKGRRLETTQAHLIRRYVEMGFGIGLVAGFPARERSNLLHERSMSRYFGRPTVSMVWKRGLPEQGIVRRLIQTIQQSVPACRR